MVHGSSLSEVITREDYYLTSGGGKVGDTWRPSRLLCDEAS
jgi:hypothetical protein